uniref:Reverse transcriptase domain-containing protein n=1 Tax=Tanacetum cinerariifolium TaxID=118510 RepID=A0A6L2J586_TANCI|nr:hypothetical protein [Tanacetum cinerariifolium]
MELDGKIVKEEEETVKRIKGKVLKEKDDPGAFIFPIKLEGRVTKNALANTGSDINTMPYRIYEQLGREEMKKVDRGITMINHTQAKAMGTLINILCQVGVTTLIAKFLILDIPIDCDAPIAVGRGFLRMIGGIVNTAERLLMAFVTKPFRTTGYDKIQKNDLWLLSMFDARHQNGYANMAWFITGWVKRKGAEDVVRSLSALIYCKYLDLITLRDLIDFEGKLIPEDPQPRVPRVGIPRPSRASMQDLYDRMGRMEICQEAIERM